MAVLVPAFSAAQPAQASEPRSWENERVLSCGAAGVLTTYLSPAGFGTPYHVIGSTDVIVPKHVVAQRDVLTITSIDVPGFDPSRHDSVHCTYTDPAGFFVTLDGIRAGQ